MAILFMRCCQKGIIVPILGKLSSRLETAEGVRLPASVDIVFELDMCRLLA